MTHGHFDHVGALKELAHKWDVPGFRSFARTTLLHGRRRVPPTGSGSGRGAHGSVIRLLPSRGRQRQ
jgi:glyoxylase-like metal-dependent hydrolase (beta-lactamase superfamily II)